MDLLKEQSTDISLLLRSVSGKLYSIDREVANHLLRTYRAFIEGFIMLQIHNSFGNPISIDESFDISMNVLISGMEQYRKFWIV